MAILQTIDLKILFHRNAALSFLSRVLTALLPRFAAHRFFCTSTLLILQLHGKSLKRVARWFLPLAANA